MNSLPEGCALDDGFVQRDVEDIGNHFGDLVDLAVGDPQDTPHIADDRLGAHGAKGDDLGHVVLAVLLGDVLDDLVPAFIGKVDVDVGG